MKVLVTGGAGYIGSALSKKLIEQNHQVTIIDNLSKGLKQLIPKESKFYEADLVNKKLVESIFKENKFDAVFHIASYKAAGESMTNPEKYSDNITGLINVLNSMVKNNVKKIIFSSSAAVYGVPNKKLIDESADTKPINFYGYTKLAGEEQIKWYSNLHNINYTALRYFNVVGDAGLNYIDPEANNILPIIMEVLHNKRDKLTIFGQDYETEDGTCVRDYIDINDLVDAHILSLDTKENHVINLGTKSGYSVTQLFNIIEKLANKKIPMEYGPRREGDPAYLVASNEKAKQILNWEPKVKIEDTILNTLKAYKNQL